MSDIPKEKLERLRRLAEESDLKALSQKEVEFTESIFSDALRPFAGHRTFLSAPQAESLAGLDFALIGLPFDLGVTNRPGARFGPSAVREAGTRVGPYHHASKFIPFVRAVIADVGDVPIERFFALETAVEDIEKYYHRVVDAGVTPLTVGGDHSITYPILKAVGRERSVGLVHFDAHCDTAGPYGGSRFHHGGPFRNAALDGVLDPERTIQIGIRGTAELVWQFSHDSGMTVIHIEEFHEMGIEAVIGKIHEVVGEGPTYLSLDVDGIDPSFTPGTGTPEVGGLTPIEVQQMIRSLSSLNLVGGDVVEVAPEYDQGENTALVAATMLFEMLCVMCERWPEK